VTHRRLEVCDKAVHVTPPGFKRDCRHSTGGRANAQRRTPCPPDSPAARRPPLCRKEAQEAQERHGEGPPPHTAAGRVPRAPCPGRRSPPLLSVLPRVPLPARIQAGKVNLEDRPGVMLRFLLWPEDFANAMVSQTSGDMPEMCQAPEQWGERWFRQDVPLPAWHGDSPGVAPLSSVEFAVLIRAVFSHADDLLAEFSDDQVAHGLRYLASPANSDYMFLLRDGVMPAPVRRAAIASIADLFSLCFEPRCESGICCLGETFSRLNELCYDWWDILPFPCKDHDEESLLIAATIEVLSATVRLGNAACTESSLRGLGILG